MWGLSTVVASRSTKAIGSQGALAWVMLIGGALTLALAPLSGIPHDISGSAWAWAVAAGIGSAFGLSMMYRALRVGKVGVVAPIASTEGALAALLSPMQPTTCLGSGTLPVFPHVPHSAIVGSRSSPPDFHGADRPRHSLHTSWRGFEAGTRPVPPHREHGSSAPYARATCVLSARSLTVPSGRMIPASWNGEMPAARFRIAYCSTISTLL